MPNTICTRRSTEHSLIRAYTDIAGRVKTLGRAKDLRSGCGTGKEQKSNSMLKWGPGGVSEMSWALNTERWDTGTRENANYALGKKKALRVQRTASEWSGSRERMKTATMHDIIAGIPTADLRGKTRVTYIEREQRVMTACVGWPDLGVLAGDGARWS